MSIGVTTNAGQARAQAVPVQFLRPPSLPTTAPQPAETSDQRGVKRWYGYQIMAVDAASLALLFGAYETEGEKLLAFGILGTALGGPGAHMVHERGGEALLSFALRVVVPAGAFLLESQVGDCSASEIGCIVEDGLPLALTGLGAVMLVDWLWLSRADKAKSAETSPLSARSSATSTWRVAPLVSPEHAGLSVAGAF